MRRRLDRGFTLAELMLVVAIIAILASIAVPKVAHLIRHANEAATKGKMGAIRSALSIYYADNEGLYPADLTPLMVPGSKYLTGVLPLYTFDHGNTNNIDYPPAADYTNDSGNWGYVGTRGAQSWGTVWIECTHTDQMGYTWTEY